MKFLVFITTLFAIYYNSNAQIDLTDSTVQVISYFEKGEKYDYTIYSEKLKIVDNDTNKSSVTYDIEVSILDSTENSYTIEWNYKQISTENANDIVKRLMEVGKGLKLVYTTNEIGVFLELKNYEEVMSFFKKAFNQLKVDIKHIPNLNTVIDQLEASLSTKEAIESNSLKEIRQFHHFYGGKFKKGFDYQKEYKVANTMAPDSIDAFETFTLDEINNEDNNYLMLSTINLDSEQLKKSTLAYLNKIMGNYSSSLPTEDEFGEFKNETLTDSRIHNSGWLIYSIQSITIQNGDELRIEKRTIEMK